MGKRGLRQTWLQSQHENRKISSTSSTLILSVDLKTLPGIIPCAGPNNEFLSDQLGQRTQRPAGAWKSRKGGKQKFDLSERTSHDSIPGRLKGCGNFLRAPAQSSADKRRQDIRLRKQQPGSDWNGFEQAVPKAQVAKKILQPVKNALLPDLSSRVHQIQTGLNHTLALNYDTGEIYVFGSNQFG